jgi:hypothetical protein
VENQSRPAPGDKLREFRVPSKHLSSYNEDWVVWIVWIVATGIGFAILFFIVYGPQGIVHRTGPALVFALIALVFVAMVVTFLMFRRKLERFSQVTLLLGDGRVILRQPGNPDIAVALSEISSLYGDSRFLVVIGGDPPRRIAIPTSISDFELVKAELARHAKFKDRTQFRFGYMSVAAAAVCCWFLIFSSDARVVKIAASLGSAFLLWSSVQMYCALRKRRTFLALTLAMSWIAWLFLIYLRLGQRSSG